MILAGPPVWNSLPQRSDYWRGQFQTISEDVSVRNVLMHSAIRHFTTMRYINRLFTYLFTYLLTYLLTNLLTYLHEP